MAQFMSFEKFLAVKCDDLPWKKHLYTGYVLKKEVMIKTYERVKDKEDWEIKGYLGCASKSIIDVYLPSYWAEEKKRVDKKTE